MYRRPSREKELTKRILSYSFMTIAVGLLVTLLTLIILGYRLDNGQLERRALLQFSSEPSGANVLIDGKDIKVKTSGKYSVIEGVHTFTIKKDGYHTWEKTLDVRANTLTWLNYIRLVPISISTETVSEFTAMDSSLVSPNKTKLLVQEDAKKAVFKVANLRNDEVKINEVLIEPSLYTSPTIDTKHVFVADRWDQGSRFVLVKHIYDGMTEWLVIDTEEPLKSKNITTLLDVNISNIDFSGTNGNILYALIDGNMRKLDLAAATISRVLVSNVSNFDIFDTSIVAYAGYSDASRAKTVVGIYRDGDEKSHVLREVEGTNVSLKIDVARYFNQDYVAIAEAGKVDILVGAYPLGGSTDTASLSNLTTFSLDSNVIDLEFSENGDYLLAQSLVDYAGYDVGYDRLSKNSLGNLSDLGVHPYMKWFDTHHLWSSYGDSLVMYDFDGSNAVIINKMARDKTALLSANEKYIYSVDFDGGKYILQRAKL